MILVIAIALANFFPANRFDAVMHFAAFAEVGESMLQPAKYFQNNTCATLTLLEWHLAHPNGYAAKK